MNQVFISYVEEDHDTTEQIARGLTAAGYHPWHYEADSLPGSSYIGQIIQALQQSSTVVVVISPRSLDSRQVDREVHQAHEDGKEFIPILKGVTHEEFRTRRPDWAMIMGASVSIPIPADGVPAIIPRVVAGLRALEAQRSTVPVDRHGDSGSVVKPVVSAVREPRRRRVGWLPIGAGIVGVGLAAVALANGAKLPGQAATPVPTVPPVPTVAPTRTAAPTIAPTRVPSATQVSSIANIRIDADSAYREVQRGTAVLIDVGTRNEYIAAHARDAIWLPLGELERSPAAAAAALPAGRRLIFYCT